MRESLRRARVHSFLKRRVRISDAFNVQSPRSIIRHPGVLTIALTMLAASDMVYRLLLRGPVRRALGMVHEPRI
jgi:hypothetical protein